MNFLEKKKKKKMSLILKSSKVFAYKGHLLAVSVPDQLPKCPVQKKQVLSHLPAKANTFKKTALVASKVFYSSGFHQGTK